MPSTYSGDPSASNVDMVRFLISDTASPFVVTNEEIAWAVTQETDNYLAAAVIADLLAGRVGGKSGGSKSVGDLSISGGEGKAAEYKALARRLRDQAYRHSPATPHSTALDTSVRDDADDDSILQPAFRRGQMDNLGPNGNTDDVDARTGW